MIHHCAPSIFADGKRVAAVTHLRHCYCQVILDWSPQQHHLVKVDSAHIVSCCLYLVWECGVVGTGRQCIYVDHTQVGHQALRADDLACLIYNMDQRHRQGGCPITDILQSLIGATSWVYSHAESRVGYPRAILVQHIRPQLVGVALTPLWAMCVVDGLAPILAFHRRGAQIC